MRVCYQYRVISSAGLLCPAVEQQLILVDEVEKCVVQVQFAVVMIIADDYK